MLMVDEQSQQFGSNAGGSQVPPHLDKPQMMDDPQRQGQADFRGMVPPANAKMQMAPQMHDGRFPNPQMQMLEMQNWQQQQLMNQYMNSYVPNPAQQLDAQMAAQTYQQKLANPMQNPQYMMNPGQFP